ncbi:MAG: hypothetical protein M5U14_10730 [Acidimicrobiia bacterium]|nr:hypothetical protein [Acidimicrobiia bacterium]
MDPFDARLEVDAAPSGPSPGFWSDFRQMPRLHQVLIAVAALFMVILFIESLFILPYLLVRWGWGYTVG